MYSSLLRRAGGRRSRPALMVLALLAAISAAGPGAQAEAVGPPAGSPGPLALPPVQARAVHVGFLRGAVDPGMARYLDRMVGEATAAGAALVLVINSTGGRVDAALEMRDALLGAAGPTVAVVDGRAWSAAALLAMASEVLLMVPGSSIGAAEPQPLTGKVLAALRAEFESTAEARGRDRQMAAAMVDAEVAIPGLVERGKLLVMTASSAGELGFSQGVVQGLEEALALLGLAGLPREEVRPSPGERLASLVTHPAVAPVLLTVAMVALIAEVTTGGFGVAGMIGLGALGLFFGGHLFAGFGGWEAAALFLLGLVLLLVEAFMPGFGVFGLGGVASLAGSIYLASLGTGEIMRSLAIALVASVLLLLLLFRVGMRRQWFARLTLGQAMATNQGFVARPTHEDMLGQSGVTLTVLRPAGAARFGEAMVDVVSEGPFIPAGTRVKVVQVEALRVVVRPLEPAPPSSGS